jgi:small-conductance mechanosensitive channel
MRNQRKVVDPTQPVEVVSEQYIETSRKHTYPVAPTVHLLTVWTAGVLVVISTFLPWFGERFLHNMTGWMLIYAWRGVGISQNFLYFTLDSQIILTGFWSLLVGVLIVAGAVTLITGWRRASGLVLVAGIIGLIISVLDIVMIYTIHMPEAYYLTAQPGAGLWLFAVGSLMAVVAGGVGLSQARHS